MAAALDAASVAWFKSFCTEFSTLGQMDPDAVPDVATDTPQQKQAKKVAAYEAGSAAVNSTIAKLSAAPTPGIPNGAAFSATVLDGLKEFAKVVGDAGAALKAAKVTDEASYMAANDAAKKAVSAVDQVIQTKVLGALAPVAPYLQNSSAQLPECAALAS